MAGKIQLVAKLAELTGSTQEVAHAHVDALKDALLDLLLTDDKVSIPGFFTARTVWSDERTGRNPATGEALVIPAKHTVKFDVAPAVKSYFVVSEEGESTEGEAEEEAPAAE